MTLEEILKASGKSVDTSKIGGDTKAVLDAMTAGIVASVQASVQEAVIKSVQGVVKETIESQLVDAIKPLNEQIAELKTNPAPKDKDTPKDKDGEPPAWAKSMLETVTELKTKVEGDFASRDTAARVDNYIQTKLPRLTDDERKVLRERIIATKPTKDEEIAATVGAIRKEYEALGMKIEDKFSAEPIKEGAIKGATGDDPEAKQQELRDKISAENQARLGQQAARQTGVTLTA